MEIEKEIQVAVDIVKAYEVTREKGILEVNYPPPKGSGFGNKLIVD